MCALQIPFLSRPFVHSLTMSSPATDATLQLRLALYGVHVGDGGAPTTSSSSASALSSLPPGSLCARGRTLVASQDFPAGSIVLQSTPHSFVLTPLPPFADAGMAAVSFNDRAEPTDDGPRRKCEWCGRCAGDAVVGSTEGSSAPMAVVPKMLRCSSCRLADYCSVGCQRSAWREWHSFECKHVFATPSKVVLLATLAPEAQIDLLLLGRCIRKMSKEQEKQAKAPAGKGKEAAPSAEDAAAAELALEQAGAPLFSRSSDLRALESHYQFMQRALDQHGRGPSSKTGAALGSSASSDGTAVLSDAAVLSLAQRLTDNTALASYGFRLGLFGSSVSPSSLESSLLPLLCAFQSNNFAITNGLMVSQGAGAYPLGALLNHSCEPNCAIVYEERNKGDRTDRRGKACLDTGSAGQPDEFSPDPSSRYSQSATHVQTIRTLRAVKAGEELTHSYIDCAAVTSKRRAQLWDRYYFRCCCTRCVAEEDTDPQPEEALERFLERDRDGHQIPEAILQGEVKPSSGDGAEQSPHSKDLFRANALWNEAASVHLTNNPARTAAAFEVEELRRNRREQSLLSLCLELRQRHLHPFSLPLLSGHAKLLHSSLMNQDWSRAIHCAEQLCRIYRVVYGSKEIRRQELAKINRRQVQPAADASAASSTSTTALPPAATEDDDDDVELVADYAELTPHALLGLQLYTLGSLYSQESMHSQAARTLRASLRIMRITHGARHPLVRKLADELKQSEQLVGRPEKANPAAHSIAALD